MTHEELIDHLDIIQTSSLKTGYLLLVRMFEREGFELPLLGGVITGCQIRDRYDRYLFACHVRAHHLLFYLRHPAMNLVPALPALAASTHATERLNQNPGGETTINLQSLEEARALCSWLLPEIRAFPAREEAA